MSFDLIGLFNKVKGFIMKLRLFLGILIVITGMGPCIEAGEIYQWIDKDGVQHFTDGPPPPGAQIVEGLSEKPSDEPPADTGPPKRENNGAVERGENARNDREDSGAVEGGENGPSDREDYWRRRGWGNDATDREDSGSVGAGENGPTDRKEPGTVEGEKNSPIPDRKID